MSGIVAVIDPRGQLMRGLEIDQMLGALRPRGDQAEVWRAEGVALGVVRFEWELAEGYSGPALLVHDGNLTVAADATLIYRNDLLLRLRAAGVEPTGATPGHLIAAAYRAWGQDCPTQLEGDFAFALYDRSKRTLFAARDFMGRRGLNYAQVGGGVIVTSTVAAAIAHPQCPRDFDDVALAETISVALTGASRTPYRSVSALPAATWLMRDGFGRFHTATYWKFPVTATEPAQPFDSAVDELRALLEAAIMERIAPDTATTIWLSGGYDSSVLYGVGNAAMRAQGRPPLRPISVSYPVGDPGREDELIEEILGFWQDKTTWRSIDDIPMLGKAAIHAAVADIPVPHAFENWIRDMLATTQREGSRVAIYGDGGDQLFAVSSVYLRDLFGTLRWRELSREWRAYGARFGGGVRSFWNFIGRPFLGEAARAAGGERRPELPPPAWIREDFARQHQLEERQWVAEQALRNGFNDRAGFETRGSLANPIVHRLAAAFSSIGLEYGVEMRAPLLDRRVVEFALRRPREERASEGAVKQLLRRAADGLLPPNILLPRKRKTGVLTGYFARSFRADLDGIVSEMFANPILAELGIVNARLLQKQWLDYQASLESGVDSRLFVAFQTELWLRSRNTSKVKEHPQEA